MMSSGVDLVPMFYLPACVKLNTPQNCPLESRDHLRILHVTKTKSSPGGILSHAVVQITFFERSGSFQILLTLERIRCHHFFRYLYLVFWQCNGLCRAPRAAVKLVALKKAAPILCCSSHTEEVKVTLRLTESEFQ